MVSHLMDSSYRGDKPGGHDTAVAKRINDTIRPWNSGFELKVPIADRLAACRAELTGLRDDGNSLDLVLRDAEYYFHSRAGVASRKDMSGKVLEGLTWNLRQSGQNIVKGISQLAGVDKWMRSKADSPNSPPGGDFWVSQGIQDGMMDRGADVGPILYHTRIYTVRGLSPPT